MDPLVPLPAEEWPRLRDIFRGFEPLGLVGYNLLDTQFKMHELKIDFEFEVYCPFGDLKSGMVAKIKKGDSLEIIILANSTDTSKLEEALLYTNIIDWSQGERVQLPYLNSETRKCLDRVYPKLGVQLINETPTHIYVYSRNKKPYENVTSCPEGTYVAPVKPEKIPQVDRVWPWRYESSEGVFSLFIKAGQSYGLYLKSDDSLIAWMFLNEAGFICHLYCEDNHRRKGYAEFVIKYVTKDQVEKGNDVYCYIVDGNYKSVELFKKMGYEDIGTASWMYFKK